MGRLPRAKVLNCMANMSWVTELPGGCEILAVVKGLHLSRR